MSTGTHRYAVSRFQNQIRRVSAAKEAHDRAEAQRWGMRATSEYFDTEAEAAAFIVSRATNEVLATERDLAKLRSKLGRIRQKFGPLASTPTSAGVP